MEIISSPGFTNVRVGNQTSNAIIQGQTKMAPDSKVTVKMTKSDTSNGSRGKPLAKIHPLEESDPDMKWYKLFLTLNLFDFLNKLSLK